MKRHQYSLISIMISLVLILVISGCPISMCASPVYAANDSFVGKGNLTEDEMHWVNDTCLKGETVQTKDGQFLYKIVRDPFVCGHIIEYIGNGSDIVFPDYTGFVRLNRSSVDLSERDDITSVTYDGVRHPGDMEDDFHNCKNLESLTVNADFSDRLIYLYDLSDDFVKTPSGKCNLSGSFAGCTNLKTVTLPHASEKLECNIGEGVFEGCTALKELDVSGYWGIFDDAFLNCTALEKVVFNENVKEIKDHAFGYIKDADGNYQRYDGLTFYGVAGTVAETYANENDIPFVAVASTDQAGDANCDNVVDVSDAVLIARFLAEDSEATITEQGKTNADANNDDDITPDDVIWILKKIAKII